MKKIICVMMLAMMMTSLAGCGDSSGAKTGSSNGSNTVQNVLEQQMTDVAQETEEATIPAVEETEEAAPVEAAGDSDYDVDLTKLSSTMVYSEVYDMMSEPDKYLGKKVRVVGQFALYQGVDSNGAAIPDQLYYACVIADATACCSQGIEFILGGDAVYPDDYPDVKDIITVSGIFETYEEDGYRYAHLVDAVLE